MERKKSASLVLTLRTIKALRLWCAMLDVRENDTVSAMVRRGLSLQADQRGEGFREALRLACRESELHTEAAGFEGAPAPTAADLPGIGADEPRRQVVYRLDTATMNRLRIFCTLTGQKISAVADTCIFGSLAALAYGRGDSFFAAWCEATRASRYPEDEGAC